MGYFKIIYKISKIYEAKTKGKALKIHNEDEVLPHGIEYEYENIDEIYEVDKYGIRK